MNENEASIKDKILPLERPELAETALLKLIRGPRDGADQGGAVVPDNGVATHEKTTCNPLIS